MSEREPALLASALATAAVLCAACRSQPASDRDPRAELLVAHEDALRAHREKDWSWFGEDTADPFLVATEGEVHPVSREEQLALFRSYFVRAEFSRYEDLAPPIVEVSRDGTLGWVLARVRAEGTERDPSDVPRAFADRWAWLMGYAYAGGRWVRVVNASGRVPTEVDPADVGLARIPAGTGPEVRAVLVRARKALGGELAVAAVESIAADASGTRTRSSGEMLPYSLSVVARANGDVHFDQLSTTGARCRWTVVGNGGWNDADEAPRRRELTPLERRTARGHAFHLIALNPAQRYGAGAPGGTARFAGRDSVVTNFSDEAGSPVRFHHDASSGLPLGYVALAEGSERTVTFHDWERFGTLRLFTRLRLLHRDEVFELTYHRIVLNEVDAGLFER